MYASGPFGEASGRPTPVSVETFHALKQRQTTEGIADPGAAGSPGQPAQLGRQGHAGRAVSAAIRGGPFVTPRARRRGRLPGGVDPAAVPRRDRPRSSTGGDHGGGGPPAAVDRGRRCPAFSSTSRAPPLVTLAEHYVATFDRRRRCCLYLTWWTDGETRRRGQSLATLKERYRRGGLEFDSQRAARLPAGGAGVRRDR